MEGVYLIQQKQSLPRSRIRSGYIHGYFHEIGQIEEKGSLVAGTVLVVGMISSLVRAMPSGESWACSSRSQACTSSSEGRFGGTVA
jgi:hypothetical protein